MVRLVTNLDDAKGLADTRVFYNTNGTVRVSDEVLTLWEECKLVEIYFSIDDIEKRFKRLVELLIPSGKMYFRANPGITWPNGPYVDIFPWSFEIANEFAEKYNLELETFKKDSNSRIYFVMKKP